MRAMILVLLLFASQAQAHAQTSADWDLFGPNDMPFSPVAHAPVQFDVTFDESDFETKPWIKEFEWVVVINKAQGGADRQSARIYHNQTLVTANEIVEDLRANGYNEPQHLNDLKNHLWASNVFKISTGREEFEQAGAHGSHADSYTITPSGYFVPQSFQPKHKSEAYSSVECGETDQMIPVTEGFGIFATTTYVHRPKCIYMENVTFFNGAIALHKAIPGTESALGTKASGGCVRMPAPVAAYLYNHLQKATGVPVPVVRQDGTVKSDFTVDKSGGVAHTSTHTSVWGKIPAHNVLIIVKSKFTPLPPKPVAVGKKK